MVQLFDTHFGQAVFGIVMVILGTAGGLFAAGSSVFVVAVFQSTEAEQLIKADQVLIAFFFTASSIQQVGRSIVLQGFPVGFVAAAFDASGHVVAVITLSLSVVFFAYQPVQIVVAVVAVQYDIRQYACSRTFGLFAGQAAGAVVLKTGIHFALAAQGFPVQVVALNVADNLAVQVNLVQMAGTIIQFVDGAPVRQGGGDAVAQ